MSESFNKSFLCVDGGCTWCTVIIYTVFAIFTLQFLSVMWRFMKFIYRHTCKRTPDFMNKYGKLDSWVVVTGGSDGDRGIDMY